MAPPRKRGWSWATGEKGKNRVRVYDRGSRGIFLDVSVRDPLLGAATRRRISLGQVDRETAKQKAEELAAALRGNGQLEGPTPTKAEGARKHDHRTLEMLRRYFGAQRPVDRLDRRDGDGFIRDRRVGKIRTAGVEEARKPGVPRWDPGSHAPDRMDGTSCRRLADSAGRPSEGLLCRSARTCDLMLRRHIGLAVGFR